MPINNQLRRRIEDLANDLQEKMLNLISDDGQNSEENKAIAKILIDDLRWTAENSETYNTVDEFAKCLHDQNLQDDLLRLKIALVAFFELEPMTRDQSFGSSKPDLDPRYLSFFEAIRPNAIGSISGDYKILSWNYDTQLELGRLRHMDFYGRDPIYCLKDSIYALNIIFKHSTMVSGNCDTNDLSDELSIYKLNGVACMKGDELYALQNEIGKALTKNYMTGILLGYKNAKEKETIPTISYAWEEDTIEENNVVQLAKQAVKDAHLLVVIGYTFPSDNRETDKAIISEMKDLEKVYIQDFNPNGVENSFREIRDDVDVELIKLETGNEPFHVPFPTKQEQMSLGGTDVTLIF